MAVLITLWNVTQRTPFPRNYVQWWKQPVIHPVNVSRFMFNFSESERYVHEIMMFNTVPYS